MTAADAAVAAVPVGSEVVRLKYNDGELEGGMEMSEWVIVIFGFVDISVCSNSTDALEKFPELMCVSTLLIDRSIRNVKIQRKCAKKTKKN